ncbi:NAD(P)/FAD-dependent oxidoreductase [Thermincola potens]|uniref:Monooxygenase FAD-binding protein n=1 Tax=Thermincola potens (strain JR) TaxID=635013 RepID=D5XAG5_THEPJ|nr:NAD(P)-binding protein [Thermincola potens]ADG81264.1 monooxygenase FAD-binding protein [Thermincola potens JR]
MRFRLHNIRLGLDEESSLLPQKICRKLRISPEELLNCQVLKKAVDARKKDNIHFVYSVEIELPEKTGRRIAGKHGLTPVTEQPNAPLVPGNIPLGYRPVIVGTGPAGLFAALLLAEYGYRPLVLERGYDVETRTAKVLDFWENRALDPECNVQFGEGGAGTFSDGKLTTRINDPRVTRVFETFVAAGAPEEILYLSKPHIGTDKLRAVVKNIRNRIIELGGQVRFQAKLTNIFHQHGAVTEVEVNGKERIPARAVVLAIGHSARDTYRMLVEQGFYLEQKAFAMGVRIEHPQQLINEAQYGKYANHPSLGAADYQLVYKNKELDRAAYTFCMCPGGQVVAAASEKDTVVTNGMSYFARNSGIANSAVAVSVLPDDFGAKGPLAGVQFQRKWEMLAFQVGGKNYNAPVQRVEDFLAGRASDNVDLDLASYRPGITPADLHGCLPEFVSEMLEMAIEDFDKKIRNFGYSDAVLTGVETRTSAPVRIVRDEEYNAVGIAGVYPAGEGAGYAGGIISAAVDGLRVAEAIIKKYRKGEETDG